MAEGGKSSFLGRKINISGKSWGRTETKDHQLVRDLISKLASMGMDNMGSVGWGLEMWQPTD